MCIRDSYIPLDVHTGNMSRALGLLTRRQNDWRAVEQTTASLRMFCLLYTSTVVVFDRIREYLGLYPKRNLKENVNNAINSTLSRTINTSGTTLVTLLAIFFFGGETIRGFIFALTVGVIVGTVATIFIATPVAYDLMAKRAKIDKE